VRRVALLAVAVGLAAGCGSSSTGRATVWVTRDRGSRVLVSAKVPAGLTAAQGLERVAKVKTRYGGRYVHAVDGLAESGRDAWFYYVNGYLADRSAAEYKLHAGDVEWWDYRGWSDPAQDPVVVGAFPEPFLHGYDGHRRETVVITPARSLGLRFARLVHGRLLAKGQSQPPRGVNVLEIVPHTRPRLSVGINPLQPGSPVRVELDLAFARRMLARPDLVRYRYAVP
jgi:uncharacterized protein DUF4430